MQTNRLYFPPLDSNGWNESAHFDLVKNCMKYESGQDVDVCSCTHGWRHISGPRTQSCRGRWRGRGRGWAAHTRPHPTAGDTPPAHKVEFMWLLGVKWFMLWSRKRFFLCIFSDVKTRPSSPSSLLPCSRMIDEGTEPASCCSKQNTEKIIKISPSTDRLYQNERNLMSHLYMTFVLCR